MGPIMGNPGKSEKTFDPVPVEIGWEADRCVLPMKPIYQQYLRGETNAADLLVEKYADMLIFYINGYIKDIHEAEDLMIEAFSQIFAKERPITGEGSFKAYLYKTARNLALRHSKKHRHIFLWIDDLDFELPDKTLAETKFFGMSGIGSSMRHWIN